MAKNDTILIDCIIDDILESQGAEKNSTAIGKTFEVFAVQQILKKYALSDDDIESCCTDDKADSGFDYIFLFVNDYLVKDARSYDFPNKNAEMEIYVITSKHKDSFIAGPLESISSGVDAFFDLTKSRDGISTDFLNEKVLDARDDLIIAYKKSALSNYKISIKFVYASRGDAANVGDVTEATAETIVNKVKEKFSNTEVSFCFFGSEELIRAYRENSIEKKELSFEDSFSSEESYVMLVKLSNYYDFIKLEDGSMNRRLFNANVRDYMGLNRVNEDILSSLENEKNVDFWFMNNGITVIASNATIVSKTIFLTNPQIVNGLQTSESICSFFKNQGTDCDRKVLVKVIITRDEELNKKIIKATNNQTPVQLVSLFATEKYQKDIEDYLKKYDMFYDRKNNYYKNKGVDSSKIISVSYLATGYVSLIKKNPRLAARLKQKTIKTYYNDIFDCNNTLAIWVVIVKIQRRVEDFLSSKKESGGSEGFLKSWRAIFSFLATSVVLKDFAYSEKDFVSLCDKMELFTNEIFEDIYSSFIESYGIGVFAKKWVPKIKINDVVGFLENKYSIKHIQSIKIDMLRMNIVSVDAEFIDKVEQMLPKQPWPIGIHRDIAFKLKCYPSAVSDAISVLIDSGKVYRQKDGILYDEDDNVVNPT